MRSGADEINQSLVTSVGCTVVIVNGEQSDEVSNLMIHCTFCSYTSKAISFYYSLCNMHTYTQVPIISHYGFFSFYSFIIRTETFLLV